MRCRVLAVLCVLWLSGCRCSRMTGEVDDVVFTRCGQAAPPSERKLRTAQLELEVRERVMTVTPQPGLRIALFTGPVGGALARSELAQLSAAKAGLIVYLGGLGDDAGAASANLLALAALRTPVLFVAGGADRLPVIEDAFESLDGDGAQLLLHGSGLRELRLGKERFAIVSGAPLGRYAVDADACGFSLDDLDEVRDALTGSKAKTQRTWLLSWAAPSGWGLSYAAGVDVGSPELFALAQALSAQGGLFAYPETQVGTLARDGKRSGPALVVPRLGRTGSSRANGGRLPSGLQVWSWSTEGLVPGA